MTITRERLKRTFSEGGAQEIYSEVKAEGDFLGFTRRYILDVQGELEDENDSCNQTAEWAKRKNESQECRVQRSALWGLTKATKDELSQLQVVLDPLIDLAMKTDNSSVRRLTLCIIERLKMDEEDLRTDFLDFCLEHMVSIKELPGIQTICMKLAFRMCKFYPELMDELIRTIETMELGYYKPAVKGLRKKILYGKSISRQQY